MKKIIFVAMLMLIASAANSQITRPRFNNTIYATHTPGDLGFGMRYDRYFHSPVGLYTSAAYGRYQFRSGYIEHAHASLGCVIFVPDERPGKYSYSISCGAILHNYVDKKHSYEEVDPIGLCPLSFEFGGGINVWKFAMRLRWDFIKKDASVDIGFNF